MSEDNIHQGYSLTTAKAVLSSNRGLATPMACHGVSEIGIMMEVHTGDYLAADNINSGHIIAVHRLKIMPGTIAKSDMSLIVFNHVADILNIVNTASVAKDLGKMLAV